MWIFNGTNIVPPGQKFTIGRKNTNSFVIEGNSLSRNHLTVEVDAKTGQIRLTDTSSVGTFLNGIKLTPKTPTPVQPSTNVLKLGGHPVNYRLDFRPLNVCTSRIAGKELEKVRVACAAAGITVMKQFTHHTTHLLCPEYVATEKLIRCLVYDGTVVSPKWLFELTTKWVLPNPLDFRPPPTVNFPFQGGKFVRFISTPPGVRRRLFEGITIYALKLKEDDKLRDAETMQACGAKVQVLSNKVLPDSFWEDRSQSGAFVVLDTRVDRAQSQIDRKKTVKLHEDKTLPEHVQALMAQLKRLEMTKYITTIEKVNNVMLTGNIVDDDGHSIVLVGGRAGPRTNNMHMFTQSEYGSASPLLVTKAPSTVKKTTTIKKVESRTSSTVTSSLESPPPQRSSPLPAAHEAVVKPASKKLSKQRSAAILKAQPAVAVAATINDDGENDAVATFVSVPGSKTATSAVLKPAPKKGVGRASSTSQKKRSASLIDDDDAFDWGGTRVSPQKKKVVSKKTTRSRLTVNDVSDSDEANDAAQFTSTKKQVAISKPKANAVSSEDEEAESATMQDTRKRALPVDDSRGFEEVPFVSTAQMTQASLSARDKTPESNDDSINESQPDEDLDVSVGPVELFEELVCLDEKSVRIATKRAKPRRTQAMEEPDSDDEKDAGAVINFKCFKKGRHNRPRKKVLVAFDLGKSGDDDHALHEKNRGQKRARVPPREDDEDDSDEKERLRRQNLERMFNSTQKAVRAPKPKGKAAKAKKRPIVDSSASDSDASDDEVKPIRKAPAKRKLPAKKKTTTATTTAGGKRKLPASFTSGKKTTKKVATGRKRKQLTIT